MRGLAALHAALHACGAAPVDPVDTVAFLAPRLPRDDVPAPQRRAAAWLARRWEAWAALPRQLVHGDWSYPNLRLDPASGRLTGVLDWEAARVDPVALDLAQIASSLLMWTERADKTAPIAALPDAYAAAGGEAVSLAAVHVAMVAYWLRNYWRSRDDVEAGATRYGAVLGRQPGRMDAVLAYVESGPS